MHHEHDSHAPRTAMLVLPYVRFELPGWGRLFKWFKIADGTRYDALWQGSGSKQIRGKFHPFLMELDLRDWCQRQTYFLGRYYDLPTQLLLRSVVRAGDRVADIGANIGMVSLLLSHLVGDSGMVEAVEPNPDCANRLDHHLNLNGIRNVRLHRCALGEEARTMPLHIPAAHSGWATLAKPPSEPAADPDANCDVSVVVGDRLFGNDARRLSFIKVDVEGFECRVLRGLTESLKQWHPVVVTEVIPELLARAGNTVEDLAGFMIRHGYAPFLLSVRRKVLRHGLCLKRLNDLESLSGTDIAWVHPKSDVPTQFRSMVQP